MDVAVGLSLEGGDPDDVVWIAAELVEFVDHDGATHLTIGGRHLRRARDGTWIDDAS